MVSFAAPFSPSVLKNQESSHTLQQSAEDGTLIFILPDVQNSESLYALQDFLYTGQAFFNSDQVKADLDWLLAVDIQMSCTRESVPKRDNKSLYQQVWSLTWFHFSFFSYKLKHACLIRPFIKEATQKGQSKKHCMLIKPKQNISSQSFLPMNRK